jgi:hypothetical protein
MKKNDYLNDKKTSIEVKKKFMIVLLFVIIIVQITFTQQVSAYIQVEPFEPQYIEKGDIPNLGIYRDPVPLEFRCFLETGHKYHIFLVGDWVTNDTEQATDYDIEVRNPSNVVVSINTESAGIPEQVANDEKHQYFIPSQTGEYRFRIYNDPRDSAEGKEDAAIFMIIEHLEINTRYTKELFGKPNVGANYPSGNKIAYEFNTSSPEFILHIEVPDPYPAEGIRGLDMYEARVFPMGNSFANIGYTLQGIELPRGLLLNGTLLGENGLEISKDEALSRESSVGIYGGYNLSIPGFSFPDKKISCESAGVDMRRLIEIRDANATDNSQNVFNYLVLLAEYFEGEVEFYLKTDFRPVNLTLIDPPEVGYTSDTTLIKVETESTADISSMWIEYSIDEWKNNEIIELTDQIDYWLAVLSSFNLHENVDYRIHAVDEIDNVGLFEGSFTVMNKVEIDFGVSGSVIQGGQTVKITGAATRPSINLKLNIEHGGTTKSINIQTDGDGVFTYDYKPTRIGEHDLTISYAGDEDYHSAVSREKSFRVDKRKLELETRIEDTPVKVERPMTVTGRIMPPVNGLEVDFVFVSPDTSFIETVTSSRDGTFSLTITPEVDGAWEMLPQLKISELYDASQGSLINFEVQKLTPIDIVKFQALKFMEPPRLYVLIGLGVILVAVVVQKTGLIDKIRGNEEDEYEDEEDEETVNGGATAYRRRSERT